MTIFSRLTVLFGLSACCLAVPLQLWPAAPPSSDELFLDQIEHKAFDFFWNEADPKTGLIPDGTQNLTCSIASVGFGLSAICVADSRKWITHEQAYQRVLLMLRSFQARNGQPDSALVEGKFGLFFHFVDKQTGRWHFPDDCVSTADSALLLCGVLTCGEYFHGTEIEKIADQIYRACQWDAFTLDDLGRRQDFIAMGYIPPERPASGSGYVGRYIGYSDNAFLIYLLGVASPTHPLPVAAWRACQSTHRHQVYQGVDLLVAGPPGLAFYYYPHCWLDLRHQKDQAENYFQNTVNVVRAQQYYCREVAKYPNGLWGLSSCISASGYGAYGAPVGEVLDDGTLTPHALAGGLVFTPAPALEALTYLYQNKRSAVWGQYGFGDAYNVVTGWSTLQVLGLDEGPVVLMIENYRTGLVWKTFTQNRHIQGALRRIGFVGVLEDFEDPAGASSSSAYRLLEGKAKLSLDPVLQAEGKQALKIMATAPGELTLALNPQLQDFRAYAYLAFWGRNLAAPHVELFQRFGTGRRLPAGPVFDCGIWKKYYFPLPPDQVAALGRVAQVRVHWTADAPALATGMGLDGLVLTYQVPVSLPAPPAQVRASAPRNNGVVQVTFTPSAAAYAYDVRFFSKPIATQADFAGLTANARVYPAGAVKGQKTIFQVVPSPGPCYAAVEILDDQGLRSLPALAPPFNITNVSSDELITDFTPGFGARPVQWEAGSSIRLEIGASPENSGRPALDMQYNKTGLWDYAVLNLDQPLDVRPYRFLKVEVLGQESLIVKLFTTQERQADIATLHSENSETWNELAYDLWAMAPGAVDPGEVHKLLFFPAPGQQKSGEIHLRRIWLSN